MTRYQAIIKLLRHGELTLAEIAEIMGGTRTSCYSAIGLAVKNGKVYRDWVGVDQRYFLRRF